MEKKTRSSLIETTRKIVAADYEIVGEEDTEDGCHVFVINRNQTHFRLTIYLKTISSAYLKYDSSVDRIQIPPIPSIHKTGYDKAFLLVGIKDDVLVAWNPQRYTHHEKYRSAYIFQENIRRGEMGYYSTMDHENKIYVCKAGYFSKLLDAYIKDTYVEAMEW